MGNQRSSNSVPQELEERWFPILYTRYEARPDSCGHGKRRGGFALVREWRVLTDEELTIHGDREIFPPWGIGGGTNAGGCALIANKGRPDERNLGMYATGIRLNAGDEIYYTSSGGGGYGHPLERDPELVLEDIKDEWLTMEAAKKFYGVVAKLIDEDTCDYEIDWEATKRLREELAKTPLPEGLHAHQVHPFGKRIKPGWEPTFEEVQPHITVSRPPGW